MTAISREKLKQLSKREEQKFVAEHPKSAELYARARKSLLGGVPMNWMRKWAGAFPVFVERAKDAHFTDVDGRKDGALAGCSGGRDCEAAARRHHADAAHGRFCLGWQGIAAAVWHAVLAICVDGNGCEPVCDSHCAGDYPAIKD